MLDIRLNKGLDTRDWPGFHSYMIIKHERLDIKGSVFFNQAIYSQNKRAVSGLLSHSVNRQIKNYVAGACYLVLVQKLQKECYILSGTRLDYKHNIQQS